jgi:hypothetical protein
MNLLERQKALYNLGKFLGQFKVSGTQKDDGIISNNPFFDEMLEQINQAVHHNGWFTLDNVLYALETWSDVLKVENIQKWTTSYNFSNSTPKAIGIVTAGNIPLVGFHDFIAVLMSGHKVMIKQSSNDQKLLPVLVNYLIAIEPRFKDYITFTDTRLQNFDAVIATGSNNTARYFEHYFNKYPHIIRKNRNAVAILTGDESESELEALGDDIFKYFGLGCRSVSKVFVPKDYNFDNLFKAVFKQNEIINYTKYKNNYDYNKTVYLMSRIPLVENGFLVLKEDTNYASPIATLFYEYYESIYELKERLEFDKEQIQCVVSNNLTKDSIPFGKTQQPQLWEYADGVDTMEFLLRL